MRRIRFFLFGPRIFGIRPGVSVPADAGVLLFALRTLLWIFLNFVAYAAVLIGIGEESVKTLPEWVPTAWAIWTLVSSLALAFFVC